MDWDIIGHEWAAELLSREVASGSQRQAYLFTGPQGVGRRTMALRLAQALNCLEPPAPGKACYRCRICRQTARMAHADLSVVQAERLGGTLRVDQVRELQHSLALAPYEARFRVALLLRFEEAHIGAMNALLKTLEEPQPKVVLALTAESAESLLPTIVSRCEVIRLRPVPLVELSLGLQKRLGIDKDAAQLFAHLSGGRPGYALRLQSEPELMELRNSFLDAHIDMLQARRVEQFAYVENLAKDRDAFRMALTTWLALWRDVLLKASGDYSPMANPDREEQISTLAESSGLDTSFRNVKKLRDTISLLDKNVNPRLALEVLMLDLSHT
jgi:DNA polymerase-3 subunit delta'